MGLGVAQPSRAPVRARTSVVDRDGPSSQRGVKGPFRAITRAITPGQSGAIMVTHGHSTEGHPGLRRDKTAGQTRSDLRLRWWPGAGSNRRPSDFQADTPDQWKKTEGSTFFGDSDCVSATGLPLSYHRQVMTRSFSLRLLGDHACYLVSVDPMDRM